MHFSAPTWCTSRWSQASSGLQILHTSPLRILTAPPPALDTLAFANTTTGWAGGAGVLLGTRDGGRTWAREWTGQGTVTEINPVTPSVVYAFTDRALLRTEDGGQSWSTLREPGGVRESATAR